MHPLGSQIDYLSAFFGGILMSLTPCVYPLLPVSIGYIGIRAGGSKVKGFLLSLIYVTGLAVTYSVLGLLASLGGQIFGAIAASPISRLLVGGVIFFFGLSMLEVVRLPLPSPVRLPALKQQNYFSTFLLGLISGLMISPCVTPVLGSILFFLAAKKHLLYGTTLLFIFAYGMGLIFIVAGIFSTVLINLPKSGRWMVRVKKVCALILIGVGVYFIFTAIPKAFAEKPPEVTSPDAPDFRLKDLQGNLVSLSSYRDKKPVILFFWTTWCPYCRRELRYLNKMYPQIQRDGAEALAVNVQEPAGMVRDFLKSYNLSLKVLLDQDGEVAQTYQIMGVPTYILIDKKGNQRSERNEFPERQYEELIQKKDG